jgi:hypothetical protein
MYTGFFFFDHLSGHRARYSMYCCQAHHIAYGNHSQNWSLSHPNTSNPISRCSSFTKSIIILIISFPMRLKVLEFGLIPRRMGGTGPVTDGVLGLHEKYALVKRWENRSGGSMLRVEDMKRTCVANKSFESHPPIFPYSRCRRIRKQMGEEL